MPNRVLRDWTNSDKINSVSVHAERFFTRLIMQADDFGRFHASPRLLSSYLFPLKDDMRDADITRCLTECEAAGLIVIYEASGKKYLQIVDFNQQLRQKNSKYPEPEEVSIMPAECQQNDSKLLADCKHDAILKRNEKETETKGRESVGFAADDNDNVRLMETFKMLKSATTGYDEEFLKVEAGKFLNKYPNCIVRQAGGLINSWAARLNKQQQEQWKKTTLAPVQIRKNEDKARELLKISDEKKNGHIRKSTA